MSSLKQEPSGGAETLAGLTRSLARSTAFVSAGNLAYRGANFVLLATLPNIGGSDSETSIQLYSMLAAYAAAVNLRSSAFYAFAKFRPELAENKGLVVKLASLCAALLSVPVAGFVIWAGDVMGAAGPGLSPVLVAMTLLGAFFLGLQDFAVSSLTASGEFFRAAGLQFAMGLNLLLCAALAILLPAHVLIVVLGATIVGGAVAMGVFLAEKWREVLSSRWAAPMVWHWLRFSLPLVLSSLLVVPFVVTLIALMSRLDSSDRAAFFIAQNWQGLVMALPGILSTTSLSYFLKFRGDDKRKINRVYMLANLIAVGVAIAGILIFIDPIARMYGGLAASISGTVVVLVMVAIPLSLAQVVSNNLMSLGRTRDIFSADVAFALCMFLSIPLDRLGLIDLRSFCFLVLLSHCVRLAVSAYLLRRYRLAFGTGSAPAREMVAIETETEL